MTKPDLKTNILLFAGALALLAFTLGDQLSKRETFGPKTTLAKDKEEVVSNINFAGGGNVNPPHGQPGHQCGIPVGASLNAPKTVQPSATSNPVLALQNLGSRLQPLNPANGTNSTTNAALSSVATTAVNPAHGQAGHRCDIAVGAPLNSAPAATPVTAATTAPSGVPPKNNPEHGKPFHRCDIAVGAPLNSKPTAKTNPPTPIVNSPAIKPDTSAPVFAYDSTGARLNPAHGKPGHDCSIAVGSPLKN